MTSDICVYLHINPLTNKPFYVGIGTRDRAYHKNRNKIHKTIVQTFPDRKFKTLVIYKLIDRDKAYRIEKQIIKRCGRLYNNTGYLANIHKGGPLEHTIGKPPDWRKGKTYKDICGPNWVNPKKGKTYKEMFGDKADEMNIAWKTKRLESFRERMTTSGKTEKEAQRGPKLSARRQAGNFTEKELEGHKKTGNWGRGKTMKERVGDPNYISPNLGRKTGKPAHNSGKKAAELYGENYKDPKANPFIVKSSLGEQRFESQNDFVSRAKVSGSYITKFKTRGSIVIVRKQNTRHAYSNGDVLTMEYIKKPSDNSTIDL